LLIDTLQLSMDAMKLIDSLPRWRPVWQSLFLLLLSLNTVSVWGQAPQKTEDDWILLGNPVLFPGSGPGKVRAIFGLGYKEEGMSKVEVNVVLLVGQPGVVATCTEKEPVFPYSMSTNRAEVLAEHYFDMEYLVSTTSAGLKAQFRVSGSYYISGEKRSVDYLGPMMDVPGNGNTGTLIVNSKVWDPTAVGEFRLPTAEEIAGSQGVELNRAFVSRMDSNGRMSVSLAPGDYEFYAFADGRRSNPEVVRVQKDGVVSVDVVLDETKEFWSPLVVDQLVVDQGLSATDYGIVSSNATSLVLRFRSFGKPFDVGRRPNHLDVNYQDANGNQVESVEELFVSDPSRGLLECAGNNWKVLKRILAKANGAPLTLSGHVSGEDFQYEFRMGTRKIQGKLKAPPSRPALSVANRTVAVWLMGPMVTLVATTDKKGHFELPVLVPEGVAAKLRVTVVGSGGMNFHGDATFSTLTDQNVTVTLLGPDDLLNGVRPFQLADRG
jgi:hypothetical protein